MSSSPTYESVCGNDGHTEAIRIEYDPSQVTYEELLDKFWDGHRPAPAKAQYKSAIWTHSEEQKQIAERTIQEAGSSGHYVDLDEAKPCYDAEDLELFKCFFTDF
eukprot:TRINITY_DN27806_c0_g1_i2.p2 TRINITY_DN27806_c0_g1~~TRINITY_DN27806_c0_g1_i2.p2  ORF type:complete len:105 (+),score=20.96 TRINITY_DN27806_c0_g1_i2:376-690(+)